MTMVLSSCSSTYIVTANYDVCYPDGVKNYNEKILFSSWNEPTVKCYSIFGTNYISVVGNNATLPNGKSMKSETLFKSSTAPMRLNSFYVENTKKKNTAHKVKNKDDIYITMNDILSH
jgi:hypothetical protein